MNTFIRLCLTTAVSLGTALSAGEPSSTSLPPYLSGTDLFVAGSTSEIGPENLFYSPQYPLWSDGAEKRRWLHLPSGTSIDAAHAEAWEFPPGTRLWKEFSIGSRIETRYIERRADGSWQYATYIWKEDGSDAVLAPTNGVKALTTASGARYSIPSEAECRACHEGATVPVLGIGALQLSSDRDLHTPHAEPARTQQLDLRALVARGLLRNFPREFLDKPPRISAATPTERAALGYLHGNCGHCHNDAGPLAPLGLALAQDPSKGALSSRNILQSLIGVSSRFRASSANTPTQRIVPGQPDNSMLVLRLRSRNPLIQMPPIGTYSVDAEGLALIERWIQHDLPTHQEITP